MPERRYYVCIMASKSRVLYVGVTGFPMARVLRHKAGEGEGFTSKYRVHRLVYFHGFQNVGDAIARETEIKKWPRESGANPGTLRGRILRKDGTSPQG